MAHVSMHLVQRSSDWAHTTRYAVAPEKTSAYAAWVHGFHTQAVWMQEPPQAPDPRPLHYASAVGFSCLDDAPRVFQRTWQQYRHVLPGAAVYHIIQSFDPEDEISAETAHQIGRDLVREAFPQAQAVVGTHMDRPHMHNHVIVNDVHPVTGRRAENLLPEGLYSLHAISNRLCDSRGLTRKDTLDRQRFGQWTHVNRKALYRDLAYIRTKTDNPEEMLGMLRSFRHEISVEDGITWVRPEGAPRRVRVPQTDLWPQVHTPAPHVFRNLDGIRFQDLDEKCTPLQLRTLEYAHLLGAQQTDRRVEITFSEYKKLNAVLDTLHFISEHSIENMQQLGVHIQELRAVAAHQEKLAAAKESRRRELQLDCRAVCVLAFPDFYALPELQEARERLERVRDIREVREERLVLEAELLKEGRALNQQKEQIRALSTFRRLEPQMRRTLAKVRQERERVMEERAEWSRRGSSQKTSPQREEDSWDLAR